MKKLGKKLPDKPGVYFFLGSPKRNEGGKKGTGILYIGKATSLRSRVRSYFGLDLIDTRGPKLVKMLEEATSVDYKETDSVLEALILEAALIKKHQPYFNTIEKDDKSFNYVVITKENFPRVLIVRGQNLPTITYDLTATFGPFPHGLELREALKIVRKIFPFRDKCSPLDFAQGKTPKRCFDAQIGLCPGVCSGEISKGEYAKVIRSISLFFKGRKQEILRGLRKHMKQEAQLRNFEKAAILRNKIFALEHINDIALIRERRKSSPSGFRIEAYDVAHISGIHTVGAMVVMEDGVFAKHEYKRFKIHGFKNDDPGSLGELLGRRFKHAEWRRADLIVVDGGQVQMNVAQNIIHNSKFIIPLAGVLKDDKHKPLKILGDSAVVRDYHHDIFAINAEAHRFAIAYHRTLRSRGMKIA
ncbi:MAG TPA: hypothetical protein VJG48_01680 [Candidatus Paceibacterota bacterium]